MDILHFYKKIKKGREDITNGTFKLEVNQKECYAGEVKYWIFCKIEDYQHLFIWLSSSFTGKFKPSIVRLYNIWFKSDKISFFMHLGIRGADLRKKTVMQQHKKARWRGRLGLSRFSVRMLQDIKEEYKSQGRILRQKLTLCSLSPWCNNYNLLKIYNFFLNYSCKGDQLIWFFECYLGKEILCKCFPCC